MSASNLPIWAQYVQALGPVAVTALASIVALGIQRRMWRNAENKLKIELFDKRLKILEGINIVRSKALTVGNIDQLDLNQFDVILSEAEFLFDKSTNDFIREIREKLVFLLVYDRDTINESGSERSELIKKKYEYKNDLLDAYKRLVEMIKPFMDLSRVRL